MKIATFNTRGGGSGQHWSRVINEFATDIVMAQETRKPSLFAPGLWDEHRLTDVLWSPASHEKWGSALWVRDGVVEPLVPSGSAWWAADGVMLIDGREVLICSVHLALTKSSYVASANRFLDLHATCANGRPMLVGGDWNLTVSARPNDDERALTSGERKLHQRLREEIGLLSAWNAKYPGAALPQTLRWGTAPLTPYHIDSILVPAAWTSAVREVQREVQVVSSAEWEVMSDHSVVVVELDSPWRAKGMWSGLSTSLHRMKRAEANQFETSRPLPPSLSWQTVFGVPESLLTRRLNRLPPDESVAHLRDRKADRHDRPASGDTHISDTSIGFELTLLYTSPWSEET